jgi:hypothetical protein
MASKKTTLLQPTWFIDHPIDMEHHQYILMAFIQRLEKALENRMLSSAMKELMFHQRNIEQFKISRLVLKGDFTFTKEQAEHMHLISTLTDVDSRSEEIKNIINWAIPKLDQVLKKTKSLWADIEGNMHLFFVGSQPEEKTEGYVMIRMSASYIVDVYKFTVSSYASSKITKCEMLEVSNFEYKNKGDFEIIREKIQISTATTNKSFIGVDITTAYPMEESVIPVLEVMLANFSKKNMDIKRINIY